ncbi:MAG: hypothetical protein HYU66_25550 [Armatimonadetes bacterium]|nr:hypothetical protein [Armatimonadota bacterium]
MGGNSLLWPLVLLTLAAMAVAQAPILTNPGFEATYTAKPGADGKVAGWTLADPPLVPDGWSLNNAYPGRLEVRADGPHGGERYVRLTSPAGSTHLYQVCQGLKAGETYLVTVWFRGGPLNVSFYEYFPNRIGGQAPIAGATSPGRWRRAVCWYSPGGEGYDHSALALSTAGGASVDVDDVSIEPLPTDDRPAAGPVATFATRVTRLTIGGDARLNELRDIASGTDYAAGSRLPMLTAVRDGVPLPAVAASREGDVLTFRFYEPEVRVRLRVTPRNRHLRFEVVDAEPADVDEVRIELPAKALATRAWAMNATYDDTFGTMLFGTTVNSHNLPQGGGAGVTLRAGCTRAHGLKGAAFAFVAAPRAALKDAVIEAERQNGVPCPVIGGKWQRDSESNRKSYLFSTGTTARDVDTMIEYAKLGGFGTLIFLKNDWLATHGHFSINETNFPGGLETLKAAVRRVHAAGLEAGVHVFGPSISPDDAYVTPKPDDGLASVLCPPLGAAVDEKAGELTLAAPADAWTSIAPSQSFPGNHLRVGDELVQYGGVEAGPPFRFTGVRRGALGTPAVAHPAGTPVKGLLSLWGFFLVDPDSPLADAVCRNFARVFNACAFDFVYFDASDGVREPLDTWYYLNKMHLGYWRAIGRHVLYQTSMGTGGDLTWHFVPRSASADGHGDIKGYLDERWPGILSMGANWTKADIGWYYWFSDVRPDQMEYVCAKALSLDGSISMETSREATERLTLSRPMYEMLGRWERARHAAVYGEPVRAKLREMQRDFRLFEPAPGKFALYRAQYEEPRAVELLDGKQNAWTIQHDGAGPAWLGVEIVRGRRQVAAGDYASPASRVIEAFDQPEAYRGGGRNDFEKFVIGGDKVLTETGPVRKDVTQSYEPLTADLPVGPRGLVYRAENRGEGGGWGGIGRRFDTPLDLRGASALGLWVRGDGQGETLRVQLRDSAGRSADFLPEISFKGWRLLVFPLPAAGFDPGAVEYLLFYFNNLKAGAQFELAFDSVRVLPPARPPDPMDDLAVTLNGRRIALPAALGQRQALTAEGPQGATLWPGGMQPGRKLAIPAGDFALQPGDNAVTLTGGTGFAGDLTVLLYRLWPMEG